jgi:hypothetical protein
VAGTITTAGTTTIGIATIVLTIATGAAGKRAAF